MTTTKTIAALAIGCISLSACTKKENQGRDELSPTISEVLINGAKQISQANAGDTIVLSASFSDDRELGKLDIIVEGATGGTNWTERKYVELSGKSQNINESIVVLPNAKEGTYKVNLEYSDAGGNKAQYNFEPFAVVNTSIPEFVDFDARFDNGYDYQVGDTLRLFGQAIDDEDIKIVAIRLTIPQGYAGNQVFYEEQFSLKDFDDLTWGFETDGQVKVYFPKYSKTGTYKLSVSVVDSKGNIGAIGKDIVI